MNQQHEKIESLLANACEKRVNELDTNTMLSKANSYNASVDRNTKKAERQNHTKKPPNAFIAFLFSTRRGIATFVASVFIIIALSVGLPTGLLLSGETIVEHIRIINQELVAVANGVQLQVAIRYVGRQERLATSSDVIFFSTDTNTLVVDNNGFVTVAGEFDPEREAEIVVKSVNYNTNGVRVQMGIAFNPQIVVAGVPTTANLNTRFTLPRPQAQGIATESMGLTVGVEVRFNNEPVKEAIICPDTGFAIGTTSEIVEFDINNRMYFYPTQIGFYEILYYVVDAFGNRAERLFFVAVEDRQAPTLMHIASEQIPSNWGLRVFEGGHEVSAYITFPFATFVDNSGPDGILRVSFEIRNADTNQRLMYFWDIRDNDYGYGTSGWYGNRFVYDPNNPSLGIYRPEAGYAIFTADGFRFNFANVEGITPGRFVARFIARDTPRQNISTVSFEINLHEEFVI